MDRLSRPVELNFRDVGAGPAIVFLHGWGMSLDVWDRQVTDLGDRFRIVTVDLRGHGGSPKPFGGYDYEDHAADVVSLLQRLDIDDCLLVGWSMGGGIAARVAGRSGAVSRLVLVGAPPQYQYSPDFPAGRPVADCVAFLASVLAAREQTMWETAIATFHRPPSHAVAHWLYQLSLKAPTWAVKSCFEGVLAADVRPDLAALDLPILMIHGVHDVFITIECARWVKEHLPTIKVLEFEHSGHAPFIEERAAFNSALVQFATASTIVDS